MPGLVLPTVRVAAVQAVAEVAGEDDRIRKLLTAKPAASMILNPQGQAIAGPLLGNEGILYADCDLGQEIVAKQAHDIVGTYQRGPISSSSWWTPAGPARCGPIPVPAVTAEADAGLVGAQRHHRGRQAAPGG